MTFGSDFKMLDGRGAGRVRRPDADGSEDGLQRLSCMNLASDGRHCSLFKRGVYCLRELYGLYIEFEVLEWRNGVCVDDPAADRGKKKRIRRLKHFILASSGRGSRVRDDGVGELGGRRVRGSG